MLSGDPPNPYANYSGTGNTLNFGQAHVRKMVMDSLRYWKREMHVDGFRFDLASVFSRNADGSLNWGEAPIFSEIAADPELGPLRLTAEPWDTGAFQLGRGFPGMTWLQWNGRFRDDTRRFVKGDPGMVADLMRRIYGSDDLFPDSRADAYHAYQSVNYVTSHDGFTLYDLVSFDQKRNWTNGHNNQDGMEENYSWNCGHEGVEGVPPAKKMIAFRKSHPTLCRTRFWREEVSWYGTGPAADLCADSHSLAFCLHGASKGDDDLYVMINAYWEALDFAVQEGAAQEWKRVVDTALPSPDDMPEHGAPLQSARYLVAPRSIVVLLRSR
jgi:pullulanase/glycogen debranching enzyme